MSDDTRALIRHLYFVEQVPFCAIVERLSLSAQAVRGALVLPGGEAARRDPAPVATALVANVAPPAHANTLHGPAVAQRPGQRHR